VTEEKSPPSEVGPFAKAAEEVLADLMAILPTLEKAAPDVVKPVEKACRVIIKLLKFAKSATALLGDKEMPT
jgi:hypothetical protein